MAQIRTLTQAFNGGELTPEFFGQIEDVKYQTGLSKCENFIVFPHGPVANRAGTKYVAEVKYSTKLTRLLQFVYSTDQTFAIEFGDQYMRFHTQGATLSAGSPTAYNGATAYVLGDLVSSAGTNYYCIAATTGNAPPNATYWYAMPSSGIYEIPTDYLEADLFDVHYVQSNDVLTLTHPNYPPAELRRLGATQWTLTDISFASELAAPTSISATAGVGSGSVTYNYTVTAVNNTGIEESLQGTANSATNDLTTSSNYNTITWSAVSGATRYNVYKQSNGLFGYIGQTDATTFNDENITADVSRTPPIDNDPFSGANNHPAAVSYFEQRRCFAGTDNQRQNLWMTRSGTESNLSYRIPSNDDDGISFRVAAREANTIRHIVPLADLMLLTSSAEWRVTSINTDKITPTSVSVKPQSYIGANNVQPVIVNNNIIYAASRGGHLRELAYSNDAGGYLTGDLSLRAPHLFNGKEVVDICYAKAPYPIVWSVSSDGKLIGLTYVPEQRVGAFHKHTTATLAGQSSFESSIVVTENDEDALYAIVQREINGSEVRYIERLQDRAFSELADAYFVDCGATYDDPKAITAITKANPGVVTAAGHGYSNGDLVDLDDILGMTELNGVRVKVSNKTTNTFELQDEDGADIDTSSYTTYKSGGKARKTVTTLSSGLDHLEGETVNILTDGGVHTQETVTGGAVSLNAPASRVQIGLPITADIRTLPLAFQAEALGQGREKNVNKAWIRVNQSSGIFAGPDFDKLTEYKQRSNEVYGAPPALVSDEAEIVLKPSWNSSGRVAIRQTDPLPLTITSMTIEVEIGA